MTALHSTTRWLAFLTLALHQAPLSAAAQSFNLEALGSLPGYGTSQAYGLNNHGQVVGYCRPGGTLSTAFFFDSGVMSSFGALPPSFRGSMAFAINDDGQVAGCIHTGGVVRYRAVLYHGGTLHDLGTLGGIESYAYGINNLGQVVGYAQLASGEQRAFLYTGSGMTDLGTLGGNSSTARALNDRGQVVGEALTANGQTHAFLVQDGTMTDLGTLGGSSSRAMSINNQGQIVGFSNPADGSSLRGFLYRDGQMTDLGTLGGTTSRALDINESGQVVGTAATASGANHAFLFSGGVMVDLNTRIAAESGWTLQYASAINDRGQIAGYGYNPAGQIQAFILTPIPEPSSLCVFGLGASLLPFCRRKAPTGGDSARAGVRSPH